jgi:tetratricopeptide (TPR) repeat protein
VSQVTKALLDARFQTAKLGELQLTEHAAEIETFLLAGFRDVGPLVSEQELKREAPIVGRGSFLDLIDSSLMKESDDRVMGFTGAPGIGKSRLFIEIALRTLASGRSVLKIVGQSLDKATPLGVLSKAVLMQPRSGQGAFASKSILDACGETAGGIDEGEWDTLSPDARNNLLIERWIGLIMDIPAQSGLAIIVDDFHYLDGESKTLLSRRATRVRGEGHLMFLGTRPVCQEEVDEIAESNHILTPLSEADALHLVRQRWHATGAKKAELPNTIGKSIQRRAQGMPLALCQFSDHCFDLIRAGTDPLLSLPHKLDTIFRTQIDSLDDDVRTIFQMGCVLGYEFELSVLEQLIEEDRSNIDDAIDTLVSKELLFPLGDGWFRFAHQLFQEAGYLGILKRQREKLHEQAYQLLKVSEPSKSSHQVHGWHAERAGLHLEALDHFAEAMKDAIGNGAILTVDEIYAQAIQVCANLGEEGRGRKALFLLHAFDALQQLGKQEWYRADVEDAARYFEEQGDLVRTALATGHLAITDWTGGRNRQSLEIARRAKDLAYKTGHEPLMIYGDFTLGNIEFLCGEPRKGIDRLKALVSRLGGVKKTARFGDMISVPGIMARTFSSWYLYDMGEAELAREYCEQGKELAQIVNQNYSHVLCGLAEAYLLYRDTDYAAASALLENVLTRCHEQSIFGLETIACARYSCSLVREGRLDEAEVILRRHQTDGHLAPVQHSCAYYYWEGEARLHAARGKPAEALAILKRASKESERQNDPLHLLHGHRLECEVKFDAGIEPEATLQDIKATWKRAEQQGFGPLAAQCEQMYLQAVQALG